MLFPVLDIQGLFEYSSGVPKLNAGGYAIDWQGMQQLAVPSSPHFTIWDLVLAVLLVGIVYRLLRITIQFISLLKIHKRSSKVKLEGIVVRRVFIEIAPFSFFGHIYLNPKQHDQKELAMILSHEKVHVKQRHSLDILLAELCRILFWFNPVAWLMKNAIKENLEFLTDSQLLKKGTNIKKYQYSLLKNMAGEQVSNLANSFNFYHLKKRIKMMNKQKSSNQSLLRYLFFIPVVAFVAIAATASGHNNPVMESSVLLVNTGEMHSDTTTLPENFHGIYLVDTKVETSREVNTLNPENIESIQVYKGDAAVKHFGDKGKNGVIQITTKKPGKAESKAIQKQKLNSDVLYVIDGSVASHKALEKLNPDEIASIDVLKEASAIKKYGEKGKNGVVEITLKKESD